MPMATEWMSAKIIPQRVRRATFFVQLVVMTPVSFLSPQFLTTSRALLALWRTGDDTEAIALKFELNLPLTAKT